jgi:hypothetical protein
MWYGTIYAQRVEWRHEEKVRIELLGVALQRQRKRDTKPVTVEAVDCTATVGNEDGVWSVSGCSDTRDAPEASLPAKVAASPSSEPPLGSPSPPPSPSTDHISDPFWSDLAGVSQSRVVQAATQSDQEAQLRPSKTSEQSAPGHPDTRFRIRTQSAALRLAEEKIDANRRRSAHEMRCSHEHAQTMFPCAFRAARTPRGVHRVGCRSTSLDANGDGKVSLSEALTIMCNTLRRICTPVLAFLVLPLVGLFPPLERIGRHSKWPILGIFDTPPVMRFWAYEVMNIAFMVILTFIELPIQRFGAVVWRDYGLLLWAVSSFVKEIEFVLARGV